MIYMIKRYLFFKVTLSNKSIKFYKNPLGYINLFWLICQILFEMLASKIVTFLNLKTFFNSKVCSIVLLIPAVT